VRICSLAAVFFAGLVSPAFASEPQFGRWAVDPQHCAGDTKAGPLVVTARSVSLASESCTIGKMYKADRGLYIEGRCSNGARHPITLEMRGDRLVVRWNAEPPQEMRRCG
jgi:hypothetical protein